MAQMFPHFRISSVEDRYKVRYELPEHPVFERVDVSVGSHQILGYYLGLQRPYFRFSSVQSFLLKRQFHRLADISAQFFFVIIDQKNKTVSCITDHMSSMPCYYKRHHGSILISPVLDEIVSQDDLQTLNHASVIRKLIVGTELPSKTIFDSIVRMPAGCVTTFDLQLNAQTQSYLLPYVQQQQIPEVQTLETFQDTMLAQLTEVLQDYRTAIAPHSYGNDLSSGLDCTLVAAQLASISENPLTCLTINDEPPYEFEDNDQIRSFSQKHNLTTYQLKTAPLKLDEFLAVYHQLYPGFIKIDKVIPQLEAYRQHNVQVFFTGSGGDEMYGIPSAWKRYLQAPYHVAFETGQQLRENDEELLNEKAFAILRDRSIIEQISFYPYYTFENEILSAGDYFRYLWQYGLVMLSPLQDYRLLRLWYGYYQSEVKKKYRTKHEFWKNSRHTIFDLDHVLREKSRAGSMETDMVLQNEEKIRSYITQYSVPMIDDIFNPLTFTEETTFRIQQRLILSRYLHSLPRSPRIA